MGVEDVLTNRQAWEILVGNAPEVQRGLPAESVHLSLSSPPYMHLRSYNTEPQLWDANNCDCEHDWQPVVRYNENSQRPKSGVAQKDAARERYHHSTICGLCGAMLCELGQEPTREAFVRHLVQVYRETKRVLRPDGVCLIVIADSFAGSGHGQVGPNSAISKKTKEAYIPRRGDIPRSTGVPEKNCLLVPYLLAVALQEDGWIVRGVWPWVKWRSAMPEPVTDRPGMAHETVIMLTKRPKYHWDGFAVLRESVSNHGSGNSFIRPPRQSYEGRGGQPWETAETRGFRTSDIWNDGLDDAIAELEAYTAYLKRVRERGGLVVDPDGEPLGLMVNPYAFKGTHYASYPPRLVSEFIKAACPERVCVGCGTPYRRLVATTSLERYELPPDDARYRPKRYDSKYEALKGDGTGMRYAKRESAGWERQCDCATDAMAGGIVLDPFAGVATTLLVATELNRRSIGVELNEEYATLARERLAVIKPVLPFAV